MTDQTVTAASADFVAKQRKYLAPGVATYYDTPIVMSHGAGCYLYASDGTKYLDFFGGILTVSVGHAHPRVNRAVIDQIQKLTHVSTLYVTTPMVELAQRLAEITPGDLAVSFFTSSGTEANETAIAMARMATGAYEVVALRHSYSGRSALAATLTGQAGWRLGMHGTPGVVHAMNAYCYRCPFGKTPDRCGLECAKDMEETLRTSTSGRVAAVIAEPIQGVGGFITPPDAYFQEIAETVRKYGGLFIADEVQTGFGRTGRAFGIEHSGVQPDLMTFAKGLANGHPIGATIATPAVAAAYTKPTISTFGGNPVSMRAALTTLDVIAEENLTENARVQGQRLREGLEELQRRYPMIGDVRGKGLMQGMEFVRADKEPAPDLVAKFAEYTRQNGLLIGKGGLYGNTVRIAPAMNVSAAQVQEALEQMAEALARMTAEEPELARLSAD
ncbi:aspartate aminotransferase family protein [Alicyclobacillus cycloheptanicus]|uniref:alanine--glyoxylate transaminase n=1 Tax=Alicyclobacillus cycloheptanicus TaxID=1457 RepID=A0ABT9XEF0_9BACL|nr:aspartate aminotransferase family protein [Alicyclobacillus cycloheptanicus]MDQ0188681.1 4-aminobutyrate aminotransferase-like enzyme [Alicyclobacillus cycloheptanicus]WDM00647.1 aspartate aminotransferase family protein [Alicyclobacillus cycloheptanicus]